MKVLLVSEGGHELSGALQTLLEKLLGQPIKVKPVAARSVAHVQVKGQGRLYKKAVRAILDATEEGCDGVVFVVDEDGDADRQRQLDLAQDYDRSPTPRAMGIAIRTFDAWMLADEVALSTALQTRVQRQPSPEAMRDPKSLCQRLCDDHLNGERLTVFYTSLAEHINVDVLAERCPEGFAPFARRVKALRN